MNTQLLKQRAEMLEEYFGIHIDEHGNVCRLPVILDQYTPDMDRVPEFALCLGNDTSDSLVDWEDEKNCIQAVSAALGNFYAMHPLMLPNPSGKGFLFYKKRKLMDGYAEENTCDNTGFLFNLGSEVASLNLPNHVLGWLGSDITDNKVEHELLSEAETAWAQREWSIQHVLFPSMRLFFKPPVSMATDGTFVQMARRESSMHNNP
ncbi:DNA mismatch repair protein MLH1, partial [Mucuna pruriens]